VSLDGTAKASEQQARDLAGAFLFSGIEQDKPLGMLSGGERSRAVLAGLVAGAHNVLVLDEPTNHLDIPSAERLEAALNDEEEGFDGTLLLITHDRMLLQDTCDKLIIFDARGRGSVKVFPGSYADWERRQRDAKPAIGTGAKPRERERQRAKPQTSKPTAPKRSGLAAISVEKLESTIEDLQQRIASIDQQMTDPAVYADGNKCKALQIERAHLERELEPIELEWARRAEG
jgi:ATP-binding cassette subfamily F protein 3